MILINYSGPNKCFSHKAFVRFRAPLSSNHKAQETRSLLVNKDYFSRKMFLTIAGPLTLCKGSILLDWIGPQRLDMRSRSGGLNKRCTLFFNLLFISGSCTVYVRPVVSMLASVLPLVLSLRSFEGRFAIKVHVQLE